MRELFSTKAAREHPLAWVVETLESEPSFALRPMFGGRAVHLHGRMVLYLTLKKEPWRGVLVPTLRDHQPALQAECPALSPHPILGKWLYLPEAAPSFERDAAWIVRRIRARDARIGIEPGGKRRKRAQGNAQSRKRG
jgi:hypothetical protein